MDTTPTTRGVPAARPFRRCAGFALAAAAAVVGFLWLAQGVALPLHRRGVAQAPLGLVNAAGSMLAVPGNFLHRGLVERIPSARSLPLRPGWVFLAASFLFYASVFAAAGLVRRALGWPGRRRAAAPTAAGKSPPGTPDSGTSAERPSRRRLLLGARRAAVGGVLAAGAYPMLVEPRRLAVTRRSFPVRDLPAGLDGLRVVQLTDIHLGAWNSAAYVRRIVEAANSLAPDLIVLTGDYVLHSADYVAPVASALSALRAPLGVVGVLGNHDWWEDGHLTQRELARAGVRLIDNGRVFVTPSRKMTDAPQEGLCVAGVGDLWTDEQLYDRALGGLPREMPRLLLSHNPDVAEERAFLAAGHRVDLMLSGHTHGGQVFLPVVGALATMSRYGQKYVRGLVQGPACPVYVSRGLGMAMLPLRFGSVPEIAVIELARA